MKRILAIIMMAATLASCVDDFADVPGKDEGQGYKLTIKANKAGIDSKALALDGKTLKVKWYGTDNVSVFHEAWSATTTLTPIGSLTATASNNASTTLTGNLTEAPAVGEDLHLLFPRATWDYTGQKGVLLTADDTENSIEKKYDYALSSVHVNSIEGNTVNTSGAAALTSQQAIVKFNLQNAGGSAINATSLTISAASGQLVQRRGMKKTYDLAGYEDVSDLPGYYVYVETTAPVNKELATVIGDDMLGNMVVFQMDDTYGINGCKRVVGAYVYRFIIDQEPSVLSFVQILDEDNSAILIRFNARDKWSGTDDPIYFSNGIYLRQNGSKKVDVVVPVEGEIVMGSTYGPLTITPDGAASSLTVALRNDSGAADTYQLTAIVDDDEYFFEQTGVNFLNGKYYEVTVKMMAKAAMTDLSTIQPGDYYVEDGEILTGVMDAPGVRLIISEESTVTLFNAEIYSVDGPAIECATSATIILNGTNILASSNDSGIKDGGVGTTLTFKGSGTLYAIADGTAIGSSIDIDDPYHSPVSGDIILQEGTYYLQGEVCIGATPMSGCSSVTIWKNVTRLTLTNEDGDTVDDFINADVVTINAQSLNNMLNKEVYNDAVTEALIAAGFNSAYIPSTRTWTISKN